MSNCNRHSPQSMMGLGSCAACAFDAMQGRIADLECDRGNLLNRVANLLDMVDELKSMKHDLERLLAAAQPTAQQVDDARDAAPTLKALSKDEAHLRLHQAINAIKIGNKTDDKLIFRELRKIGVVLAALQSEKENGNE